ncbi:hypothetical protein RND71_031819 [Anisodus tanguticus]|uniref:Uncharacterized protein n=1 Tax=Anisodus tanguticus TaxID=243964 RepID=A0AAE1RBD7_9SOLA|nr:hypothetical protein RND71_031819 [Anisodus tanguticus]
MIMSSHGRKSLRLSKYLVLGKYLLNLIRKRTMTLPSQSNASLQSPTSAQDRGCGYTESTSQPFSTMNKDLLHQSKESRTLDDVPSSSTASHSRWLHLELVDFPLPPKVEDLLVHSQVFLLG